MCRMTPGIFAKQHMRPAHSGWKCIRRFKEASGSHQPCKLYAHGVWLQSCVIFRPSLQEGGTFLKPWRRDLKLWGNIICLPDGFFLPKTPPAKRSPSGSTKDHSLYPYEQQPGTTVVHKIFTPYLFVKPAPQLYRIVYFYRAVNFQLIDYQNVVLKKHRFPL